MKGSSGLSKRLRANWRKLDLLCQGLVGSEADVIEAETMLGRDLADAMQDEHPVDKAASVVRFLRDMGAYLTSHLDCSKYQFTFQPVLSRSINAYALPGGFIFVTRGLMEFCEWRQGEIAFVVAHEIGHVVRHHARDAIASNVIIDVICSASPAQGILHEPFRLILKEFVDSEYSKDCELEADTFAVRLTKSARFPSGSEVAFLERVTSATDSGKLEARFQLFQSHPPVAERIGNIRRTRKQLTGHSSSR